jgi:hypothetical protein
MLWRSGVHALVGFSMAARNARGFHVRNQLRLTVAVAFSRRSIILLSFGGLVANDPIQPIAGWSAPSSQSSRKAASAVAEIAAFPFYHRVMVSWGTPSRRDSASCDVWSSVRRNRISAPVSFFSFFTILRPIAQMLFALALV